MTNQGRTKGVADVLVWEGDKIVMLVPNGVEEQESLVASRITLTAEQKLEVKRLVRLAKPDKEVDLAQIISTVTGIDIKTLQGKSLYLVDMLV